MQQHSQQRMPRQTSAVPPRNRSRSRSSGRVLWRVLFGLFFGLLAVVALFASLGALLLYWGAQRSREHREAWRWMSMLAFGGVLFVVWLWQASPLSAPWHSIDRDAARHLWRALLPAVLQIWTATLPLAPALAGMVALATHSLRRGQGQGRLPVGLREMTLSDYEQAAREEQTTVEHARLRFQAMTTSYQGQEPVRQVQAQTRSVVECLGTYAGGELAQWIHGGQFVLTPEVLRMHGVVVGEPGYGRTVTLIRLLAMAQRYGRKLIYIDLKGSQKTAAHFLAAMHILGVQRVRMYPMEAVDGWRGGAQALFNRLMEQVDPKTHPFYRAGVAATVVSLVVHAPVGPPTDSYDFLARLDAKWLKQVYASDAQALREIKAVTEHLNGLTLVFSGFFRGIAGALDGSWSFEDCDACYIGIDGTANKEEAATLGRYLLEDAAHYATNRKDPKDQVTLIVDEFGVLRSTNATSLYERVREAGMSIFVAGQSYESFGVERNNLLASAAIKIVHRTGAPEPFVAYAGEREQPRYSYQIGGAGQQTDLLPGMNRPAQAGSTPDTLMGQQKEYAISIEEVQQLGVGQVVVIHGGEGASVQVTELAIPQALEEAARRFLAATPTFTRRPPPPTRPDPESERGSGTNETSENYFTTSEGASTGEGEHR